MNSQGKFWSIIWSIFGVFVLAASLLGTSCMHMEFEHEEAILASGISPVLHKCAHLSERDGAEAAMCALLIQGN